MAMGKEQRLSKTINTYILANYIDILEISRN